MRVDAWLKEFREYEQQGNLPQFQVVRIGGDHTEGTRADAPTPRAHVAENDFALGRLVEAVTHSERYWKETAIFVLEDDAQNGPDHVDAHRSIAFVVSPYTKRHFVDSTMYTTSGMLRTMELILGLPPMSQYDAAANPMYVSFGDTKDLTPFGHQKPLVDVMAKNTLTAYGSRRSMKMDFTDVDEAPMAELNEILWRSIKGADAIVPAPVHRVHFAGR